MTTNPPHEYAIGDSVRIKDTDQTGMIEKFLDEDRVQLVTTNPESEFNLADVEPIPRN